MKKTVVALALIVFMAASCTTTLAQTQQPTTKPEVADIEPQLDKRTLELKLQYVRGKMAEMQLQFPSYQEQEKALIQAIQSLPAEEEEEGGGGGSPGGA